MNNERVIKTITISAIQFRHLCKIESHPVSVRSAGLVNHAGRYQTRDSLVRLGLIDLVKTENDAIYQVTELGKDVSRLADMLAQMGYAAPYKVHL
jgi:predicted transcriptional regulator with HTH domain